LVAQHFKAVAARWVAWVWVAWVWVAWVWVAWVAVVLVAANLVAADLAVADSVAKLLAMAIMACKISYTNNKTPAEIFCRCFF
jgi:hypothetical protein